MPRPMPRLEPVMRIVSGLDMVVEVYEIVGIFDFQLFVLNTSNLLVFILYNVVVEVVMSIG
jgi:hypothetical protein